jgi:hypothetical protein
MIRIVEQKKGKDKLIKQISGTRCLERDQHQKIVHLEKKEYITNWFFVS